MAKARYKINVLKNNNIIYSSYSLLPKERAHELRANTIIIRSLSLQSSSVLIVTYEYNKMIIFISTSFYLHLKVIGPKCIFPCELIRSVVSYGIVEAKKIKNFRLI